MPGYYKEHILLDDVDVALVGLIKDKTIICDDSGKYENSPLMAYGRFNLYNLSFRMTIDESVNKWKPTYNKWPEDYPCYALHIEGDNRDINEKSIAKIYNCDFYSEANSSLGMGLHSNQTVVIKKM